MNSLAMLAALRSNERRNEGEGNMRRNEGGSMRYDGPSEGRGGAFGEMNEGRGRGYTRGMEGGYGTMNGGNGMRYDRGVAYSGAMPYPPYVPPYIAREDAYSPGGRSMGEDEGDEAEMEMMGGNVIPMDAIRRRVGFGNDAEMYRGQPRTETGRFKRRSGMAEMHMGAGGQEQQMQFGGMVALSPAEKGKKLTRGMAEEWVDMMENEDEAHPHGGKFSMEQAKQLAQGAGMSTAGQKFIDFYAAINAMYSDYHKVAKKHGVDKPEYYADLAKAWVEDADAVPNKAYVYYKCIVNHE